MFQFHTKSVSECHFTYSRRNSVAIQCICGNDLSTVDVIREFTVLLHDLCIYRKIVLISLDLHPDDLVARFFEFRCDDLVFRRHIHGKRHQCRRNVYILERSGHTVFSADRRQTKSDLCIICAEKRCKRLTPSIRIFCHTTEILLECKADLPIISAGCYDLCNRFHNRINRTMIRTPTGQIRIKTEAHH